MRTLGSLYMLSNQKLLLNKLNSLPDVRLLHVEGTDPYSDEGRRE